MAKKSTSETAQTIYQRKSAKSLEELASKHDHVYGDHVRCKTDTLGKPMPSAGSPLELVVDATDGFIPLWKKGTTLRWRFQEQSLAQFENVAAVKKSIRSIFAKAVLAWGDAVPIRFSERKSGWDFEIVVREADDCNISGCVLAAAFFPDSGQHELTIYPKMFEQPEQEQIETLAHEIGHVFGLRHFFAKISETKWPAEIFGTHKPFSIMNYGADSKLTDADRADLKSLYTMVWNSQLTQINGTPIRAFTAFHST